MIKGITVILHEKSTSGVDPFNAPLSGGDNLIEVKNVLVEPIDASAVYDELTLKGVREAYRLCIPKGDEHDWRDVDVEFFGKVFHSYGGITEYIEDNLPLKWNKKVTVERYE